MDSWSIKVSHGLGSCNHEAPESLGAVELSKVRAQAFLQTTPAPSLWAVVGRSPLFAGQVNGRAGLAEAFGS